MKKSHLEQLKDILVLIEGKPGFEENTRLTQELIRKHELSDMLDNTLRIAREMGKAHIVEADIRQAQKEVWALDEVDDEEA
jgi:bacterioferritin (cytochrome b1)